MKTLQRSSIDKIAPPESIQHPPNATPIPAMAAQGEERGGRRGAIPARRKNAPRLIWRRGVACSVGLRLFGMLRGMGFGGRSCWLRGRFRRLFGRWDGGRRSDRSRFRCSYGRSASGRRRRCFRGDRRRFGRRVNARRGIPCGLNRFWQPEPTSVKSVCKSAKHRRCYNNTFHLLSFRSLEYGHRLR